LTISEFIVRFDKYKHKFSNNIFFDLNYWSTLYDRSPTSTVYILQPTEWAEVNTGVRVELPLHKLSESIVDPIFKKIVDMDDIQAKKTRIIISYRDREIMTVSKKKVKVFYIACGFFVE
jgi:hypothetical protein